MKKSRVSSKWLWILGMLLLPLIYMGSQAYYHLLYHGIVENVTFQSGDITLSGVLVRPATQGPHPGIVLLHGSGQQTHDKWYYRIHTNEFVRKGFAVLSFDKRGSGSSGGNLQAASFQDLVSDGLAAVSFLRSQPDINPDQIGLFGVSESGWFTPEIAAKDGNMAFIVNRVSPPLSWRETVSFEIRNDALKAGIPENDIEDALSLQSRIWQFYIDSAGNASYANGPERDEINALITDMQKRPRLNDFFNPVAEYEAEAYAVRASKYTYDPYPFLLEIDIPMLYIMAGKDVNVPTEASVNLLEKLKQEQNKNITIKTYPDASHYLYRWDWLPLEGLYIPGYSDLIGSWAAEQIR